MAETSKRGFASMDAAKQREIASKGGRAAHQKGTAHEFDSEEAREAGRKGGEAVSRDRQHMAEIGAEGGRARAARSASRLAEQERLRSQQQQPYRGMDDEESRLSQGEPSRRDQETA